MIIIEDKSDANYQIKSYRPGYITVNDQTYSTSLIISEAQLITDWRPQAFSEFQTDDWQPILALKPEIILFGTGKQFQMPAHELLTPVYAACIGIESMDTGAACRTFMALVSEHRRVIAALLIY